MRFDGKINTRCRIDYATYFKDLEKQKFRSMPEGKYTIPDLTYFTADVYGQFIGGVCSYASPASVVEQPGGPERPAEMEVSTKLVERLRNDGETSEENLKRITWIIANRENVI